MIRQVCGWITSKGKMFQDKEEAIYEEQRGKIEQLFHSPIHRNVYFSIVPDEVKLEEISRVILKNRKKVIEILAGICN